MAAGAETPSGAETRRGGVGVGVPPSTSGTPSTAYLNRARDLAERVQASMLSELSHDPLYSQLASSPATTTFAASRAKEIMDQLIAAGGDAGWRPSGDPRTASLEEGPRSDSHHHRPGGGEETDPSTPTPLRTTTNTAASTRPPTRIMETSRFLKMTATPTAVARTEVRDPVQMRSRTPTPMATMNAGRVQREDRGLEISQIMVIERSERMSPADCGFPEIPANRPPVTVPPGE